MAVVKFIMQVLAGIVLVILLGSWALYSVLQGRALDTFVAIIAFSVFLDLYLSVKDMRQMTIRQTDCLERMVALMEFREKQIAKDRAPRVATLRPEAAEVAREDQHFPGNQLR